MEYGCGKRGTRFALEGCWRKRRAEPAAQGNTVAGAAVVTQKIDKRLLAFFRNAARGDRAEERQQRE